MMAPEPNMGGHIDTKGTMSVYVGTCVLGKRYNGSIRMRPRDISFGILDWSFGFTSAK